MTGGEVMLIQIPRAQWRSAGHVACIMLSIREWLQAPSGHGLRVRPAYEKRERAAARSNDRRNAILLPLILSREITTGSRAEKKDEPEPNTIDIRYSKVRHKVLYCSGSKWHEEVELL